MRNCVGSASLYMLHDTACSMIPPLAHEIAYKPWARTYTFLLTKNDAHDDKVGLCQSRFVGGQNSCGFPRASAEWARKRRFYLPLTAATRPPIIMSVTVVLEKEKEDRENAGGRLTHRMGAIQTDTCFLHIIIIIIFLIDDETRRCLQLLEIKVLYRREIQHCCIALDTIVLTQTPCGGELGGGGISHPSRRRVTRLCTCNHHAHHGAGKSGYSCALVRCEVVRGG
jgi:hypothetical protein